MHTITVSIVFAMPERQWVKELNVSRGTQAGELVSLSGLLSEVPEIAETQSGQLQLGVYAQKISKEYLLEDGDRVEVYRGLTADPKEVRRQLAELGKTMGKK